MTSQVIIDIPADPDVDIEDMICRNLDHFFIKMTDDPDPDQLQFYMGAMRYGRDLLLAIHKKREEIRFGEFLRRASEESAEKDSRMKEQSVLRGRSQPHRGGTRTPGYTRDAVP